jgi:hypothetical protein
MLLALKYIMKSIVLYILAILWITASGLAAQKPTIDLLPSTHGQFHPETVVDTGTYNDSLVLITIKSRQVPSPAEDTGGEVRRVKGWHLKGFAERARDRQWPENYPLILKITNPFRFILHATALNK